MRWGCHLEMRPIASSRPRRRREYERHGRRKSGLGRPLIETMTEGTQAARVYAECPWCGVFFAWFDDQAVEAGLADFPTQPLALTCPKCDTMFIPDTLVEGG